MRKFALLAFILIVLAVRPALMQSDIATPAPPTLRLFVEDELFVIYVESPEPISLHTLELRTRDKRTRLEDDFDVLQLRAGFADPGACFVYRLADSRLPLPGACTVPNLVYQRKITRADVFWYDFVTLQPRDIAVFGDGIENLSICSGSSPECPVVWVIRSSIEPTASPPPTESETTKRIGIAPLGNCSMLSADTLEVGLWQTFTPKDIEITRLANTPADQAAALALVDYNLVIWEDCQEHVLQLNILKTYTPGEIVNPKLIPIELTTNAHAQRVTSAVLYYVMGNYPLARNELRRLQLQPATTPEGQREAASLALLWGNSWAVYGRVPDAPPDYQQAVSAYDRALQYDPQWPEVLNNQGVTRFQQALAAKYSEETAPLQEARATFASLVDNPAVPVDIRAIGLINRSHMKNTFLGRDDLDVFKNDPSAAADCQQAIKLAGGVDPQLEVQTQVCLAEAVFTEDVKQFETNNTTDGRYAFCEALDAGSIYEMLDATLSFQTADYYFIYGRMMLLENSCAIITHTPIPSSRSVSRALELLKQFLDLKAVQLAFLEREQGWIRVACDSISPYDRNLRPPVCPPP